MNEVVLKNIYAEPVNNTPVAQPTFGQTLSSAFNLENDMVNLYDMITKPVAKIDPTFDYRKAFEEQKLPENFRPYMARTVSADDFSITLQRVRQQEKDKAVLASSGWSGTVAALGAGMISPTVFMPFIGQARGLKGMAQVLSLAAAGSSVSEGALFYNQETRTEAEFYTGVAANTILSGLLGAAYLGLSRGAKVALAEDSKVNNDKLRVPSGDYDIGHSEYKVVRVEPPTRESQLVELRKPDFVERDRVATHAAELEPPLKPGTVRVYFSGIAEGATSPVARAAREEVATASPNTPLHFMDVPETDPRIVATQGAEIPTIQLTADEIAKMPEIYRGQDPKAGDGQDVEDFLRQQEAETSMGVTKEGTAIPNSEKLPGKIEPVGAQVSRQMNTSGPKKAPSKWRQAAMAALGQVSPLYRLTTSIFPTMRHEAYKLANSGIEQGNLARMEGSAIGGMVKDRIDTHAPNLISYLQALDIGYYNHLYPGNKATPSQIGTSLAQIKSAFNMVPEGKMSWDEFNAKVYDDISTKTDDPETRTTVAAFTKFFNYYLDTMKEYHGEMPGDVPMLFKELVDKDLGEGASAYAHQNYDSEKIKAQSAEFYKDFGGWMEKQFKEEFDKSFARYSKRKKLMEFQRDYVGMANGDKAEMLLDVEKDIALLDEMPEVTEVTLQLADLRKQARDEGWTAEELKAQVKDVKDNANEAYQEAMLERKTLMATARTMRKLGGAAEEKIAKLQSDLTKSTDLIEGMFRHPIPRIEAKDAEIAKLQGSSDKMFAKVEGQLEKGIKELQKRKLQLGKLLASKRRNTVSRTKAMEKLEASQLRYSAMLDELSAAKGKDIAIADRLHSVNTLREEVVKEVSDLVRSRAERAAAAEGKIETQQALVLSPEEAAAEVTRIQKAIDDAEFDFEDNWRGKGERSGNPAAGKPDFAEASLDAATYWQKKLTNSSPSPSYFLAKQDLRGPMLQRMLKMPYEIKKKWLITNTETIARSVDRQMSPDLELWRAFGSVNGSSVLKGMEGDASKLTQLISTAKFVRLPKGFADKSASFISRVGKRIANFGEDSGFNVSAKDFSDTAQEGFVPITDLLRTQMGNTIVAEIKHQTRNWEIAIERLRHTRTIPDNPESLAWRGGKAIKDANVVLMMGGVLLNSLPDVVRPLYRHGVAKTAGTSWVPYITNMKSMKGKSFRVVSADVHRRIGYASEPFLHGRAQGMFDLLGDVAGGKTKLERGIKFLANKTGVVALFSYWTAAMKAVSANVVHATMGVYIPDAAAALARGGAMTADETHMLVYLRDKGLSDMDIHRINAQMQKPGGMEEFSNGGKYPNMGEWDDMSAYRAYSAAVTNEVNNTIVTPGLEQPNWTDENIGYSLMSQFKSFTFAANSQMAMRQLQGSDPYLVQGTLASLGMGAMAYAAYAYSAGGKTQERMENASWEDWLYESVDRVGMLGAMSLGQKIGEQIPFLAQYPIFGGEDKAYRRSSGFLGTVFGPTAGQFEKLTELMKNFDNPDAHDRNKRLMRQMFIPYQNHFLLRRVFDAIGDALN